MFFAKFVSAVAIGAAWIPTATADASFEQVRIKNLNDYSNRATDPPQKYFRACIVPSAVLPAALISCFFARTVLLTACLV